ncbi:GntR family transcriptional regulator [Agaribacterium sp. ZY112]|uniref:GntR family transcriptional regulator n=1 Tax=Agaribacterium sp. ZY112 TaxID=3233574 RepID=UPI0035249F68
MNNWNDSVPIYKQLEAQLVSWILNGEYAEGEALPSVRKLSVELNINHLTVAKAFDALVHNSIIEKRRGLGMFVLSGAREKLADSEKQKFLDQELPQFVNRMRDLELDLNAVLEKIQQEVGGGNE